MAPVVVVVVLPLLEFVVEDLGVVDEGTVQESVELLGVDAMEALDAPMFVTRQLAPLLTPRWPRRRRPPGRYSA